jgi:hypothetical protein
MNTRLVAYTFPNTSFFFISLVTLTLEENQFPFLFINPPHMFPQERSFVVLSQKKKNERKKINAHCIKWKSSMNQIVTN